MALLGIAVMVAGKVYDRALDLLLGSDELEGMTWPSTTPEGE